ncbi:Nitrogenase (fragment) [Hyella patelloides LEGE 07179]|uniref:Nitrogenase n=1 Tax=Hyella patelloides LEGE 07179 TaxID=945734 RepID=A0A563VU68_9CYAN
MNNSTVFVLFRELQKQLESIEINSLVIARLLCKIIPNNCPFERKIQFGNHTIISIPPLCKLNPFYDQLIALRFKSSVYLMEKCH